VWCYAFAIAGITQKARSTIYVPGLELAIEQAWRRWVLRGRKPCARHSSSQVGWQLRLTARYRTTIAMLFLVFASTYFYGFHVAHVFSDEPSWKRWSVTVIWTIMVALITVVFVATEIERVVFDELGITRISWRGRRHFEWTEVAALKSSRLGDSHFLQARDGRQLPITNSFDGLDTLAVYLERHARLPKPIVLNMFGMGGPAAP
jgi:hypothetical protein